MTIANKIAYFLIVFTVIFTALAYGAVHQPIIANFAYLVPTVWLYGYAQSHSTADKFHDFSGWIMLPLAFLLLLGIVRLLRWALIPVARFNLAYQ